MVAHAAIILIFKGEELVFYFLVFFMHLLSRLSVTVGACIWIVTVLMQVMVIVYARNNKNREKRVLLRRDADKQHPVRHYRAQDMLKLRRSMRLYATKKFDLDASSRKTFGRNTKICKNYGEPA